MTGIASSMARICGSTRDPGSPGIRTSSRATSTRRAPRIASAAAPSAASSTSNSSPRISRSDSRTPGSSSMARTTGRGRYTAAPSPTPTVSFRARCSDVTCVPLGCQEVSGTLGSGDAAVKRISALTVSRRGSGARDGQHHVLVAPPATLEIHRDRLARLERRRDLLERGRVGHRPAVHLLHGVARLDAGLRPRAPRPHLGDQEPAAGGGALLPGGLPPGGPPPQAPPLLPPPRPRPPPRRGAAAP